jgi:hypothetical protein
VAVIYNKHAYITKKDEKTWNTSTNLVSFGQLVVEKTDVKSLDSDVSCKMNSWPVVRSSWYNMATGWTVILEMYNQPSSRKVCFSLPVDLFFICITNPVVRSCVYYCHWLDATGHGVTLQWIVWKKTTVHPVTILYHELLTTGLVIHLKIRVH